MSRLAHDHRIIDVNFGFCRTGMLITLKRQQGTLGWRPWRWMVDPAVHQSHGVTVLSFYAPTR